MLGQLQLAILIFFAFPEHSWLNIHLITHYVFFSSSFSLFSEFFMFYGDFFPKIRMGILSYCRYELKLVRCSFCRYRENPRIHSRISISLSYGTRHVYKQRETKSGFTRKWRQVSPFFLANYELNFFCYLPRVLRNYHDPSKSPVT